MSYPYRLKPKSKVKARTRYSTSEPYFASSSDGGCDEGMEGMEKYYPNESNPEYEDFPME